MQNKTFLTNLILESQKECDFCEAKKFTAEELWGRIETEHCISAANMFKNAGPNNGIIISKKHSVLDLG